MEDPSLNPRNLFDLQLKRQLANDIKMFALHSMSYTSLKDLLPESPSSGSTWKEIRIRDPLLQHAAWAYLQPMAGAREEDERRRWWRKLLGCLNGVALVMFKGKKIGGEGKS